jgi:hypothetical protein
MGALETLQSFVSIKPKILSQEAHRYRQFKLEIILGCLVWVDFMCL